MDYEKLASELMTIMKPEHRAKWYRLIQEGIQGEAFVLSLIKEKGGEAVPGMISCTMGMSSARVAATLNSLENKGMITREIDGADRRRIIVRITQKGIDRTEEQQKRHAELVTRILKELGEHDAIEYVRITARLAEAFSGIDTAGCQRSWRQ